jgi:ammonia channel protein AmtB
MSKATITRLFLGSVIAFAAGIALAVVALLAAVGSDAFVMDGPDVVGIHATPGAWTALVVGLVAMLAVIGGSIGGLVSWIGALLNTAQIDDKTWFVVLLLLGLFSFGLVAMIAYVIGGPDGTVPQTDMQRAASA